MNCRWCEEAKTIWICSECERLQGKMSNEEFEAKIIAIASTLMQPLINNLENIYKKTKVL